LGLSGRERIDREFFSRSGVLENAAITTAAKNMRKLSKHKKRALGDSMMHREFKNAVFVRDANAIREINDVADALAFLYAWPPARRGPIYQTALRACEAAGLDRLDPEAAQNALQSFARSIGILETVPVSSTPWSSASRHGQRRLSA
jgi:hypothetical protein